MGKKNGHQTTSHYIFPAPSRKGKAYGKFNEKRLIAHKARAKKYPSNVGWITLQEITEMTGLKESKFYRLFKTKTVDQILDEYQKI